MNCTHKNYTDFTVGRDASGRLKWRCSTCGVAAFWSSGWTYYGSIECTKCWTANMTGVLCPACAKKLPSESVAADMAVKALRRMDAAAKAKGKVDRLRGKLDEAEQELGVILAEEKT